MKAVCGRQRKDEKHTFSRLYAIVEKDHSGVITHDLARV